MRTNSWIVVLVVVAGLARAGSAHGEMTTGTYQGDGTSGRPIAVGFAPDFVLVKAAAAETAVGRVSTMPPDAAKPLDGAADFISGAILSFVATGFELGNHASVNQAGVDYYWVAFRAEPGEMTVGQYVGNGQGNRLVGGLGLTPSYMIVLGHDANIALHRYGSEDDDSAHPLGFGPKVNDSIKDFSADGFLLGGSPVSNAPGVNYHYVAWSTVTGAAAGGEYIGNGLDGRVITDVGFEPWLVIVKSQGNPRGILRTRDLTGDASLCFIPEATQSNFVQALLPLGFEVGDSDQINPSGGELHWFALRPAADPVDLSVLAFAGETNPASGDTVVVRMTAQNAGPNLAALVRVDVLLPASLSLVNVAPSQGSFDADLGLWQVGGLSMGAQATLDLMVSVEASGTGRDLPVSALISATNTADVNPADNSDEVVISVQRNVIDVDVAFAVAASELPAATPSEVFRFALSNLGTSPDTLTAVALTNVSSGPGTASELDESWSPLQLLVDEGQGLQTPPNTTAAASIFASFDTGRATFSDLAVVLPAGGVVDLVVLGAPSIVARDGDVLRLTLASPADLSWSPVADVSSAVWPMPAATLRVDGMAAAQIALGNVPSVNLAVGTQLHPVMDFVVPANGYEPDAIERLNVVNRGTAGPSDLERMQAWADDGDDSFDAALDTWLGDFRFTGNRWEVTGLSHPVGLDGVRVFCTVDIGESAIAGATVQLELPSLPDVAIGMVSGNDGPLDRPVEFSTGFAITSTDRITLASLANRARSVAPGETNLLLLQLLATNSYEADKLVTALHLDNLSSLGGSIDQDAVDGRLASLRLRIDGNGDGDLDDLATDPLVGITSFRDARATFTGLSWTIPASSSRSLFVVGDVSLSKAGDGESIQVGLQTTEAVEFEDPTVVAGSWPVTGSRLTIDGLVAAQVSVLTIAPLTLGPGDGPYVALDVVVPSNGGRADALESLSVENLGTVGDADLMALRLWRDGGDGVFTGGDDVELAPLAFAAGRWSSPALSEPIAANGLRLFTTVTVGPSPADLATIQLRIPIDGIRVGSANDGPRDVAVAAQQQLLLSRAPLLASLALSPDVRSAGQTITATMTVRNVSAEAIQGIVPSSLQITGDGDASPVTGPLPAALDLAPASEGVFTWTYTAATTGSITVAGDVVGAAAGSGLPRRSAMVTSNTVHVAEPAGDLTLFAFSTLPRSINRGQTNVAALTLTFSGEGSQDSSPVLVRGLRIRLEDGAGAPIVPDQLWSRIALSEGATSYLNLTSLPAAGSEVDLILATPLLVGGRDSISLSLSLDVAPSTTTSSFRLSIDSASWVAAEDFHSGAQVAITGPAFPLVTGLANIVGESNQLVASLQAANDRTVNQGQPDVNLLELGVENPGVDGLTADAVLRRLTLTLVDETGVPLADPSQALERLRVVGPTSTHAERALTAADGTSIVLDLSPSLRVPVNTRVILTIAGDVNLFALGSVRAQLASATGWDVRDANTGNMVAVSLLSPPIEGGRITVQRPAPSGLVLGTPLLPAVTSVGAENLATLDVAIRHPGDGQTAAMSLQSLTFTCRDETRAILQPSVYLDALRVLLDGTPVGLATTLPSAPSSFTVFFPEVIVSGSEVRSLGVEIDVEGSAPLGFLEVVIDPAGFDLRDANSGQLLTVAPDGATAVPFTSGLTRLQPPADALRVSLQSRVPPLMIVGPDEVEMGLLVLVNPTDGEGTILVDAIEVDAADRDFSVRPIATVVQELRAYVGGNLWASTTLSAGDVSATLRGDAALVIDANDPVLVSLRARFVPRPATDSIRLGVRQDGIEVAQPGSGLLRTRVEPEAGYQFPLWTLAGQFTPMSLQESFSNFPNPFASGLENTTFAFVLPTEGRVSLTIYTPHGERVTRVLQGQRRAAGLHQTDTWNGLNGRGAVLVNGVYVAELRVDYDDGTQDRVLRKVAVVR